MPVIIPEGLEEYWIAPVKNEIDLRELKTKFTKWDPAEWYATPIDQTATFQMSLF